MCPVPGAVVQDMQYRHTGIDVAVPLGSLVYAVDDGVVNSAEWVPVGGLRVLRGQPIALVGMTGITTGPHVHWELRVDGKVVDPLAP